MNSIQKLDTYHVLVCVAFDPQREGLGQFDLHKKYLFCNILVCKILIILFLFN